MDFDFNQPCCKKLKKYFKVNTFKNKKLHEHLKNPIKKMPIRCKLKFTLKFFIFVTSMHYKDTKMYARLYKIGQLLF